MRIKFKEPTNNTKMHNKYNSNAIFKDKKTLNDTLWEIRRYENIKNTQIG